MKQILKIMALAAISLPLLTACSGNKDKVSGKDSGGATLVETVVPESLDMERLTELSKKNADEITSSDYDFLFDQIEVIYKPTKNMNAEERKEYVKNLDSDTQGALIMIAFGIQAGLEKGKLSDRQMKRYSDLEKKYSTDDE